MDETPVSKERSDNVNAFTQELFQEMVRIWRLRRSFWHTVVYGWTGYTSNRISRYLLSLANLTEHDILPSKTHYSTFSLYHAYENIR